MTKKNGCKKENTRKSKKDNPEMMREIKEKFKDERNLPPVTAKTENQKKYLSALDSAQVVVAEGSAGSGKSYLASATAADKFRKGKIEKIIVARPYVMMGKTSGFKPGSSLEKLYPFVRNLLDTIRQRIGDGAYNNHLKDGLTGEIEVQELESIRGRSFDQPSVLIIDEAQNSTKDDIISILTRISDNCQLILLGDPSQKDIKGQSGLEWFTHFSNKHGLECSHVHFTSEDIVRGGFVKQFIQALELEANK